MCFIFANFSLIKYFLGVFVLSCGIFSKTVSIQANCKILDKKKKVEMNLAKEIEKIYRRVFYVKETK